MMQYKVAKQLLSASANFGKAVKLALLERSSAAAILAYIHELQPSLKQPCPRLLGGLLPSHGGSYILVKQPYFDAA